MSNLEHKDGGEFLPPSFRSLDIHSPQLSLVPSSNGGPHLQNFESRESTAGAGKTSALLFNLYFCEGLLFAVVVAIPCVYFKTLGFDNAWITFWTGLLALPWTLKGAWAPFVDKAPNLNRLLPPTQLICATLCGLLAAAIFFKTAAPIILALLAVLGLAAASQDLIIDAIYLKRWNVADQTNLMWWRNTAFRIAYLLGAGLFILLAGLINESPALNPGHAINLGWSVMIGLSATLTAAAALYIKSRLGSRPHSAVERNAEHGTDLLHALRSFFQLPKIANIIVYVLVFRIGDAFLSAIAQPFLLDSAGAGGLHLKTSEVGFVYGTIGAVSLTLGGIFGGRAIEHFGVRRLLIPFSILQSLTIIGYLFLSVFKPPLIFVCLTNVLEQFSFGLTTACYSVVLLMAVDSHYKATHFAFISALMNLGLIATGMMSGYLCDHTGYTNFFAISFVLSLIGPLASRLLPRSAYIDRNFKENAPSNPQAAM